MTLDPGLIFNIALDPGHRRHLSLELTDTKAMSLEYGGVNMVCLHERASSSSFVFSFVFFFIFLLFRRLLRFLLLLLYPSRYLSWKALAPRAD